MQKVRIMALGGLDEDGKNMYVIEIADDIFVIEAGIKYPESAQLGVEYIIPDFTYLIENKKRILSKVICHNITTSDSLHLYSYNTHPKSSYIYHHLLRKF